MKFFFILAFIVFSGFLNAQQHSAVKLKPGSWNSTLKLTKTDNLSFQIEIEKSKGAYSFVVINGEERIILDEFSVSNDSVHLPFPFFNSELVFSINNKKNISGYWQNFDKGPNYKIGFQSNFDKKSPRFAHATSKEFVNISGRWEASFNHNGKSPYPALGVFTQDIHSNQVNGTFMTETGDYRFLSGNTTKDSLYLSCFDGSHAFLFKAKTTEYGLQGTFFSGNHWSTEWKAQRNDTFELPSPEELTYLTDSSALEFTLQSIDGTQFQYPNSSTKGKVIIVQLMGTWCPNCLDETIYYNSLKKKYGEDLQIISVCYEKGDTFEDRAAKVKKLQEKLDLNFTFLIGGPAQKSTASEQFDILNNVISFPTSLYIGKDGKIKRIHTGFNGPGTGNYYTQYTQVTSALLDYLIAQ